jgi:hypothetical protein
MVFAFRALANNIMSFTFPCTLFFSSIVYFLRNISLSDPVTVVFSSFAVSCDCFPRDQDSNEWCFRYKKSFNYKVYYANLPRLTYKIRTNYVTGMLQMLMDTDLDAIQLDYAETAHASGKDLISLINEVLDRAKIESGRLELEAVPFDLRAVLDNVSSLLSSKSNEKMIEVCQVISFSSLLFYSFAALVDISSYLNLIGCSLCERSWRFMSPIKYLKSSLATLDGSGR